MKFEDGTTKWYLPEDSASAVGLHVLTLKLPDDVTCYQCVLQWRYRTGKKIVFCKDLRTIIITDTLYFTNNLLLIIISDTTSVSVKTENA